MTDAAAASRVVDEAVSSFGRLDVVVNNAGYANVNSFEDLPVDDFRAQLRCGERDARRNTGNASAA